MREISQIDPSIVQHGKAQTEHSRDRVEVSGHNRAAMRAVSAENKLASIDRSELSNSQRMSGKFNFSFESSMQVSWQSSSHLSISGGGQQGQRGEMSFETNFSMSFTMSSSFEVSFGEGMTVDQEQMQGQDFSFDKEGLLKLLEELIEKLGAQDRPEIDLAGKLDDRALELLEKLGLLDEQGQATPALQMLSDFAELDRFHAGQQVRGEMSYRYSSQVSSRMLGWQGWNQQQAATAADGASVGGSGSDAAVQSGMGGANVVNDSQVGGDINIDDRDHINIHIHK